MFIGRTVEAETPMLWLHDEKSWLILKDPDAGKDWGQEEMGMAEDEMVGWHHRLNGHGFGWTLGVGDGQGGLACCSSWGSKQLDMTEWLNWTELNFLPRSKCLLILWLKSLSTVILETKTIKFTIVSIISPYQPCSDRTECHVLSFFNVEF